MKNVVSNSWSRRGVGLSLLMAAALVLAPVSAYATTEKDEPAALASTQSTSAVLTQATVTTGTSDVATTPDTATTPTTPDATTP
ncbi:MAG: hypothetical protein LKF55_08785, partial [Atopobiaceae bacterium]|nr:hypothetical protein [Atopobiaceae bacterium]